MQEAWRPLTAKRPELHKEDREWQTRTALTLRPCPSLPMSHEGAALRLLGERGRRKVPPALSGLWSPPTPSLGAQPGGLWSPKTRVPLRHTSEPWGRWESRRGQQQPHKTRLHQTPRSQWELQPLSLAVALLHEGQQYGKEMTQKAAS